MEFLTEKQRAMVRSFLTTLITLAGLMVALAALPGVSIPATWVAFATTAGAVARTALAWWDKHMRLYGRGSQ